MELRSKNKKCQKRKKNNIEEKEEYETAICPVEKGKKDDIFGKGDNQLDDPILTSLKKNKKFELYYCSAITRWKFIKTLQFTNENSFYDSLEALMKENKKVENMGNTGIIGIKAPEDTQINFYQYSRNIGSKKVQHSENDIFKEILNNGVKEKSEIILSSYYCPCPSCIGGLFDYSLSHKGITIKMYCFTFMSLKKYPSLGQFVKGKKYYNMCKGVKGNKCIIRRYFLAFSQRSTIPGVKIIFLGKSKKSIPSEYQAIVNTN